MAVMGVLFLAARKRKSTVKSTIKFEVYGILIIILSFISLAGKGESPGLGPVGRALGSLCTLMTGKFYFIIPVVAVYLAVYIMVKRQWPRAWSFRKTGILLIMVAVLLQLQMSLMDSLWGAHAKGAIDVLQQPFTHLSSYFAGDLTHGQYKDGLGGGVVGAVLYAISYGLFEHLGAKFIMIGLYAIGIICITGVSYVDLVKKARASGMSVFDFIRAKWSGKMDDMKEQKARKALEKSLNQEFDADIEEVEDAIPPVTQTRPLFFNLNGEREVMGEERVPSSAIDEEPIVVKDFFERVSQEASGRTKNVQPDSDEFIEDVALQTISSMPEKPYVLPSLKLLQLPKGKGGPGGNDYMGNARKLESTLESFGVKAKVLEVVRGPAVTRYEIQPDVGVKVSRIVSLTDDIALALAAKDIRMEAPIPGKAAIGIEVPNTEVSLVTLREVMETNSFQDSKAKLSVAFGRDISGTPIVADLAKMPHLLVAGATGSGKSVCINGIITSILYKARPDEVKFLMVDPKMVELNVYNGIPHLLNPVVTDPRRASLALKKVVKEMENRYELFSKSGTRNIEGYNSFLVKEKQKPLPFIVVIVDELADLMMVAANDVEDSICRLAQMARAAGIHLIIATQRPSVDVITGVIKANIPSRIAFGVSSQIDSRTILDSAGAEKLLGRGDMLFVPVGSNKPTRVQGAYLSDQEVEAVCNAVRSQASADYQPDMVPELDLDEEMGGATDSDEDELFDQAVQIILEAKQASVSLLQRRMRIGYTRAARLIDSMEAKGIIGPYEGSKPREVLYTLEGYRARMQGPNA
jgi:S-DNA-T family DNA segregation ATPase FtsK/SpoIIIE